MSDINEMNEGLKWYVVHTYSGYENKVKTNLEKIIENRGLGDRITDIRIPTEVVVESDGGKEKEVESKIFGFVGPDSKPVPLTDEETAAYIQEEPLKVTASAFAVGDTVNIVDGVFRGYSGKLTRIDEESGEVTVVVSTVGRDIPVNLDRKLVEKAAD